MIEIRPAGAALIAATTTVAVGVFVVGAMIRPEGSAAERPVAPATTGSAEITGSAHPTVRPSLAARAPVRRAIRYRFPIEGCAASYSRGHHDYPAADIFAAVGCRFVAPVAGRVDEVTRVDHWNPRSDHGAQRGGLSVSITGGDGVRYYGSHLSSIDSSIRPGTIVAAGRLLGRTGRSGSARYTSPHLHFGISRPTGPGVWWIRRGTVAPQPFLDAWRANLNTSPGGRVR
jgi:peptidoglycan LD-endopeptidase LytH